VIQTYAEDILIFADTKEILTHSLIHNPYNELLEDPFLTDEKGKLKRVRTCRIDEIVNYFVAKMLIGGDI
jgi:hypothetical protein